MRIPTPILIEQLKRTIPRTPWDNKVNTTDAARAEKLMREAAVQLEWFLKQYERSSKHENSQPS